MLSAIIITKNEEGMIGDCLDSVAFADELLVVDTGSTDNTNKIAKKHHAKIVLSTGSDYSQYRNDGLKAAKGDWILYVDADERITPDLKKEILSLISKSDLTSFVYALPRENIYLGKPLKYGGWGNDYVIRLFKKTHLKKWQFPLHEQPVFVGEMSKLHSFITHYSHRDLTSMLNKTIQFTDYEAKNRLQAHHPPVVWWRFFRVMATEFWHRFIKLQAGRDGVEGIIDGLFQVFNSFVIYARLWELQLEERKK